MIYLPIAERELRVAARNPKTYRSRWIMASVALMASGWIVWAIMRFGLSGLTGFNIFESLGMMALAMCMFSGAGLTAVCLSEEKRAGTLGLLFLTDLKGGDIVLGKLLATSLPAAYGLMAMLPVLALPLILGGVQIGEFCRVALNLMATLLLSLAVGLCVSAASRDNRRASMGAGLLMLFFLGGLPLLAQWVRHYWFFPELAFALEFLSPFCTHKMAFENMQWLRQNYFWGSLLTTFLLALSFLGLAAWILPRAWQDKAPGPLRRTAFMWRERWQRVQFGGVATREIFRRRALERNPFYWVAGRDLSSMYTLWFFIILLPAGAGFLQWDFGPANPGMVPVIWGFSAVILTLMMILLTSSGACYRLAEDRLSGALELVLATSLSVRTILRGQWLALRRQFLWPAVIVFLFDAVVLFWLFKEDPPAQWGPFLLMTFLAALLVIADMVGLVWVGMWVALRVQLPNHAAAAAVWRVLLLPWPIMIPITVFCEVTGYARFTNSTGFAMVWLGVGILNAVLFSLWARRKLLREFRIAATDRFQPPKVRRRWWRTVFGEVPWFAFKPTSLRSSNS